MWLPKAVELGFESMASGKRIEKYLMSPEKEEFPLNQSDKSTCISIRNGFVANNSGNGFCLDSINVKFMKNQFNVIIGPVGSGKSMLFLTILREVPLLQGELCVNGKIAYASQSPWILNMSIKDNILLGRSFDELLYKKVIKASGLLRDLDNFEQADEQIIFEGGSNLSGGQKARLSLARTLYSLNEADVFILDDVLSALDNIVAFRVIEECKKLLCGKCVLLATHQVEFVKFADQILVMDGGRIAFQGDKQQFMRSRNSLEEILETKNDQSVEVESKSEQSSNSAASSYEEKVSKGSPYTGFVKTINNPFGIVLCVVLALLAQGSMIFSDRWLTVWSTLSKEEQSKSLYPIVYSCTAFMAVLLFAFRCIAVTQLILCGCRNLFSKMMSSVLATNLVFFQLNPAGRILNRFSKDLVMLDDLFPWIFHDTLHTCLLVISIIIVISMNNPIVMVSLIIVVPAVYYFRLKYARAARQIKRIESVARSPYLNVITSSYEGLLVLRSFNQQQFFINWFVHLKNEHSKASLLTPVGSRWLSVRIDSMCNLFFVFTTILAVVFRDSLSEQNVAMSLIYLTQILGVAQFAARQFSEIESHMVGVERLLEYSELPREESDKEKKDLSHMAWPSEGSVEFNHLYLKYPNRDEPILKDINLSIKGGEKIGIVGRTGAGKSSIMAALFRIVNPESEDSLLIDGDSIANISLVDLRSRITMIPQDAKLFNKSLRFNLDATGEKSDQEIWAALQMVNLEAKFKTLPLKLDTVMSKGFEISSGEKQLLCLARAILRKSKILVMDEATANIDSETTSRIQFIMDQVFKDSTVFTIAHRISTIIDHDRIIVLEKGQLVEIGSPFELLSNPSSYFSSMVHELGAESIEMLKGRAYSKHKLRENA